MNQNMTRSVPIENPEGAGNGAVEEPIPTHKWLPVINDYCIGCGKCVKACPHHCLEPIWDFATMVRPGSCTSAADCIPVCEDDAIHMQWVAVEEGDRETGRWCSNPPNPLPPPSKSWLQRLIWLFKES
jgi:NAD-dependent dihydropyrimidine dehydrogenase PreA subunit